MSKLQRKNPDIERFSAGFIVLSQDTADPWNPKALLIQRGNDGSWGESWEGPGGGYESKKDATIKDTALRETKEEAGVIVDPETIFPVVYERFFEHKGLRMASYTFIALMDVKDHVELSREHLDWGFFGEKEVQNFGPYDEAKSSQVKHVMLVSKKRTLLDIFENRENLQQGDEISILQLENLLLKSKK